MSRRSGGANNSVRGPASALTAFLRGSGINTRTINAFGRAGRRANGEQEGEPAQNTQAGPSTAAGPSGSTASPARRASGQEDDAAYHSDNLDDSDGDAVASPAKGKKKPTKAQLEKDKAKAKAKAKAAASKKRRRDDEDVSGDEDEDEDVFNAPSKGTGSVKAPDIGSFEVCAKCESRFTVTKYTMPCIPPPGFLCHKCAKDSGQDPFKKAKAPAPRKRKLPADKRKVVNFEEIEQVKSLTNMCIGIVGDHIDDIEALGNIGQMNMDRIAKIICKNRKLTPENAQLFYDVKRRDLTLYDATALQPAALQTLASLNPNLSHLRLDLCGRMNNSVITHWAEHLRHLTRIELLGPFLVRVEAWCAFFETVGERLEGFLITQSPRFDMSCLEALMQHSSANLSELRLAEVGLLNDEWLPRLASLKKLTYLDVSNPSESLTDGPVVELLEAIGSGLRHLDLSGHTLLSDQVLRGGVGPHCSTLDTLIMSNMDLLTDAGVARFFSASFDGHPPLTEINLSRNHNLASEALQALIAHSGSEIEDLKINGWKDISNDTLLEMAKALPKIRRLDVGWCREVDDFVVKAMLDACASLTTVSCHGCNRVTENCPRKRGVAILGVESHSVIA
ncbi:hypothetical protein FRB93_006511 [Tulasnella sp. JGI-2019a]|nr:hypothetical protein FRB93_006511 [Tulasnella sp. JGI-2019a]